MTQPEQNVTVNTPEAQPRRSNWLWIILAIAALIIVAALIWGAIQIFGGNNTDAKYTGEGGTSMAWICPNGNTVSFERRVNSAVAEQRCNSDNGDGQSDDGATSTGNQNPRFCNAQVIGIPVTKGGECKFCTINYSYDPTGQNPGDVFIVGEEPMEYFAADPSNGQPGAYVYQYSSDNFEQCIRSQAFMSDPGYTPVWVK